MTTDIVNEFPERAHTRLAHSAEEDGSKTSCSCKKDASGSIYEQFVYSIGKIDIRFSTIALEKEFQQRERHTVLKTGKNAVNKGEKIYEILKQNLHIAKNITYIFSVGGIPAFVVIPTGTEVLNLLIESLKEIDQPEKFDLIIGKRAGIAPATLSGGLLLPMVLCDQVYSFRLGEYVKDLIQVGDPLFKNGKLKSDGFEETAKELFLRITSSTENIGGEDAHRALNYLLVQHPGIFFTWAERHNTNNILDSIETRVHVGANARKIVTVIFTFIDRATAVPERVFTRVDVTEEWPFVIDVNQGGAFTLMLPKFIDYGAAGSNY